MAIIIKVISSSSAFIARNKELFSTFPGNSGGSRGVSSASLETPFGFLNHKMAVQIAMALTSIGSNRGLLHVEVSVALLELIKG